MNARLSGKSRNFHVREIIVPCRLQGGSSASRAWISSSVSRVRRAIASPFRQRPGPAKKSWAISTLNKVNILKPRRTRQAASADDHDRGLSVDVEAPCDVE